MDKFFQRKESDTHQQKSGFLASQQVFESILALMRRSVNWLAGLIKLTKKSKKMQEFFSVIWETNKFRSNTFNPAN